ncbi:MAG: AbrB/MazE/SpoVT family DNA-binding domain-containing protein [Deltaproteobacteria bacterium]|jgi:AbrB family looped-hinge helix DNA binding protein|nr:AbrB/MazE/SpoVT family DNA-binding domain-containing protein [Deltaproteobacteria bacterium]MBT4266698.1 AbrB/MazE/SpoVT family DNA-binding domain-containing protein [Deltaproteobacteria bacterium]MBT4641165.1 AbrB/MazE/SpoVT family DNA-binding domain-containing protein [Deltaproteobacteria bacterium]MBT6502682.1 AbrB/MazE/SpoVT family DNA-binding domain-containing protein [Deltaproteobacteria bacterium]MBT6615787.1 AbrB/MazE/SpoVT family DNA-binding domain-containing protein [Deltaproteobac
MKVTTKGQVTIPLHIRESFGILPNTEVDFKVEKQRIYIERSSGSLSKQNNYKRLRGVGTVKMTTDEIMKLTRENK